MHLFDSIHENEHLLLYPDGTQNWLGQKRWNATEACCLFSGDVDDVGYLLGMIDEAVDRYGADPDGIVITGLSNGGFMSHRMACEAGVYTLHSRTKRSHLGRLQQVPRYRKAGYPPCPLYC